MNKSFCFYIIENVRFVVVCQNRREKVTQDNSGHFGNWEPLGGEVLANEPAVRDFSSGPSTGTSAKGW